MLNEPKLWIIITQDMTYLLELFITVNAPCLQAVW